MIFPYINLYLKEMREMIFKKGQVWMETVIYTLIALIMIGAVLTFVQPKIQEIQDKAVIDQTLKVITGIDSEISSVVQGGAGNKRIISFELKKGDIEINCPNNIRYILKDTRSVYSEPCILNSPSECIDDGKQIDYGNIKILTIQQGKLNTVILSVGYDSSDETTANLDCGGVDVHQITFSKSSTPYKIAITNTGINEYSTPTVLIEKSSL
jgi:type II secretory pathway pseudopilin PulG